MNQYVIQIEGMSCGGCAKSVERALLKTNGVVETSVSHVAKLAEVKTTADASKEEIVKKIESLGYKVVEVRENTTS